MGGAKWVGLCGSGTKWVGLCGSGAKWAGRGGRGLWEWAGLSESERRQLKSSWSRPDGSERGEPFLGGRSQELPRTRRGAAFSLPRSRSCCPCCCPLRAEAHRQQLAKQKCRRRARGSEAGACSWARFPLFWGAGGSER